MLRAPQLSPQCLACAVPLAGPLSWPARLMGIRRNKENPNLCSRCGYHLAVGEIRPAVHLLLELGGDLRFGPVSLPELSERELPALQQQLRARLEDQGALVLPPDSDHPHRLSAFFNAPVAVSDPALHALKAVRALLHWFEDELSSLSMSCGWRALLASGFVEVVACEPPATCYPMGEVSFRAADLFESVQGGQLACDGSTYEALCQQDGAWLADWLGADLVPVPARLEGLVLLRQERSLGATTASLRPAALQRAGVASQFGALLLALIAAPCAAMVVIGPGAVVIGLGAAFAALLPLWQAVGMSIWPRLLITLVAVLVASLNLIRAELAQKRFRQLQRQVGEQLRLPRSQRRRLRSIRWSSGIVLVVVLLEGLLRVLVMQMPLL